MLLTIGAKLLGLFGLGEDAARRFALVPLLVLAALLAWGVWAAFDRSQGRAIEQARDAGATGAVVAGHETTLDQLKDAK